MKIFNARGRGISVSHGNIGDYKRKGKEGYDVPDKQNLERCLNCTKKKCKGSCKDLIEN